MNDLLKHKIEAELNAYVLAKGRTAPHSYYEGLVKGAELAQEWISVDDERKPEQGDVLTTDDAGFYHIVWVGLLMAGLTLGAQAWAIHHEKEHWQTIVFTTLAFTQLAHVMAIRSERQFLITQGIFSNLPLIGAVLLTVALQLGVIYIPFANDLFKTQPLTLNELLICFGVAAILFHAVEFEKAIRNWLRKRSTLNLPLPAGAKS